MTYNVFSGTLNPTQAIYDVNTYVTNTAYEAHTLSLLHDFMKYTLRQAFCTMLHASDTFTATHKHSTSCLIRLLYRSLSMLGSQRRTLWINVPGFTGWPFCSVKALN